MANRYFNKQVAESRKPLLAGGTVKKALKKLSKQIKKNPLPKKTKDIGKRFTEAFKSKGKK
jgi:hypothetical protein